MNPKYIHYFDTHNQYENYESDSSKEQFPYASYTVEDELVRYNDRIDYSKEYLTFERISGTYMNMYVSIMSRMSYDSGSSGYNEIVSESSDITLYYSIDDSDNWIQFTPTIGGTSWNSYNGGRNISGYYSKIKFKGDNWHLNGDKWFLCIIPLTPMIVYGNILSIINSSNFSNLFTISSDINFFSLLGTRSPDSATGGYVGTRSNLYTDKNKKLILQATKLSDLCYSNLFRNRINLKYAPELPAKKLTIACYVNMFNNCTNLEEAPKLPATVLTDRCYASMFYNCSNLKYIDCRAIDTSASDCLNYWTYGVSNKGIFIKNINADWVTTGSNGVPENWEVIYK